MIVGAERGGRFMTNSQRLRDWISRIRLATATADLMLVVALGLGLLATQSAEAQTFTVLHAFAGERSDGASPFAGLVADTAGNLYGTTSSGGSIGYGTVFKVSKARKETLLHSFTGSDGGEPLAGLVGDNAGNFYGTTYGGSSGYGTVFKVSKAGKETILHSFIGGSSDGCYPSGGLLRDNAGNLYGTTQQCGTSGLGTVFKVSKAGRETLLHSFTGVDGGFPYYTGLLMDKKGNLYGVTPEDGTYNNGGLYKLTKSGTLIVLHGFAGGSDGCYPFGTPAMDTKGNLYGTTYGCGSSGEGIVWKVSENGTESVLHNFAGGSTDGANPYAGVIFDAKGNLYGDTVYGGDGAGCNSSGCGTVYELNKKGVLTLLHSFVLSSDGENPVGGVIRDGNGNLYGTTEDGGSHNLGTAWKLTP
jgi:uncharacterized repeat protein (TIGR03803 family)